LVLSPVLETSPDRKEKNSEFKSKKRPSKNLNGREEGGQSLILFLVSEKKGTKKVQRKFGGKRKETVGRGLCNFGVKYGKLSRPFEGPNQDQREKSTRARIGSIKGAKQVKCGRVLGHLRTAKR